MRDENDVRGELFTAFEKIEGGEALKEKFKAFTDDLVDKQIKTNHLYKESQLKVEELSARAPEVKEVIVEKGGEEIAKLQQTVLDMQTAMADKDKRANEFIIRDSFLKETGLRDSVARDKIDLAIMRGEVSVIDGKPVGIKDGVNIAFGDYVQSVNEANAADLRVKAGGKSEGFAGGGEVLEAPSKTEAVVSAISSAGGSLPISQ